MENTTSDTPQPRASLQEIAPAKTADYVITLVHGTWAQDAEWTSENGPLARRLREALGGRVMLHRFRWSGRNSYGARRKAGEHLRQELSTHVFEHGSAHHFVIAHSHGGNVALYAMNDPLVARSMSGLVTLATPFLTCKPRNPWLLINHCLNGALFGLGFAVLNSVVLPLVLRGIEYSHTLGRWTEIGVYLGVLWLGYAAASVIWGALQELTNGIVDRLIGASSNKQSELVSMLTTTHCASLPLLALRFRGDEARLYLALLSSISMPFPLLFKISSYLFLVVYFVAFLMVVADVLVDFARALFNVSVPLAPWILTRSLYSASLVVLVTTLIGALALPKMIRGHGLGYGREALVTPILVKVVAADLPRAFASAHVERYRLLTALRSMTAGRGFFSFLKLRLLHSWLYQYGPAIDDIIAWIKRTAASRLEDKA